MSPLRPQHRLGLEFRRQSRTSQRLLGGEEDMIAFIQVIVLLAIQ